jgi:hypothetical protein
VKGINEEKTLKRAEMKKIEGKTRRNEENRE